MKTSHLSRKPTAKQVKLIKRIFETLIICCLLPVCVNSQKPYLINYSSNDGLISNETYDIIQDGDGFIWIGTDRGLVRYDGTAFKNYSTKDGLPGMAITNLYLDLDSNVWCFAHESGFSKVDDGSVFTPQWNKTILPLLSSFKAFKQEKNGLYRIGFHPVSANPVTSYWFAKDNSSPLDSTTLADSSVMLFDCSSKTHSFYDKHSINSTEDTAIYKRLKSIIQAEKHSSNRSTINFYNNTCFTASDSVLTIYSEDSVSRRSLGAASTNGFNIDYQHKLWVGVHGKGAICFDSTGSATNAKRYLNNYSVTEIFADKDGGLWFTTIESGVFYMPYPEVNVLDIESGLPENRVMESFLIGDSIWCYYRNGAISATAANAINPITTVVRNYRYVFDAFVDSSETLNYSIHHDDGTNQPNEWPPVSCFHRDGDELIAAGTSGGVFTARLLGITSPKLDLKKSAISTLVQVPRVFHICKGFGQRDYFLGTKNGVYRLNQGMVSALKEQIPDLAADISALVVYKRLLFVGIAGLGITVLDSNLAIQGYLNTENYLSSDVVRKFVDNGDELWVCSDNGIDVLDFTQGFDKLSKLSHIGKQHGLPSNSVSDIEILEDHIWVMTDNGIAIIPRDALKRRAMSNLHFTSITVNGIEQDPSGESVFDSDQNNVEITFQNIVFNGSDRERYFYRVNESSWNLSSSNVLNFSNLIPGSYDINITMDTSTQVTSNRLTYSFKVRQPFWSRWYMLTTEILLIALLIIVLVQYRVNVIKRREKLENKIELLRFKVLRSQMNPHFIYNALNAIQNFILHKNQDASVKYLTKFSKLIRAIFEDSFKDQVLIKEELERIQLYVNLEQARYPKKFDFITKIDEDLSTMHIPPMIIQPFIENAILHGILPSELEPAQIELSIQPNTNKIHIVITDNGVGINKAKGISENKSRFLKRSREKPGGLSVTIKRIRALAKRFDIDDEFKIIDLSSSDQTNHGTFVSFYLPIL